MANLPNRNPPTPEEIAKVLSMRGETSNGNIDEFHLMIAEYGMYYGYAGIRAILDDEISLEEVTWQILAGRKVRSGMTYDMAQAVLAGTGAVNSKNPSATFKSLTKTMLKNSKADI